MCLNKRLSKHTKEWEERCIESQKDREERLIEQKDEQKERNEERKISNSLKLEKFKRVMVKFTSRMK